MDTFEILKSLHIIFVITWFAGLFYIVRLFVYHREAQENIHNDPTKSKILIEQYKLMQGRLWYGITSPSGIITLPLGLQLTKSYSPLSEHPWIIIKLAFVALLCAYHIYCGIILKQLNAEKYKYSSNSLRILNEVPTVLLFAIVFLVVQKSTEGLWYGLGLLGALVILLLVAIRIYRIKRES